MFKRLLIVIVLAGVAMLAGPASAEDDNGITGMVAKAIEDGTINLSFRYRFEFVDDDGFSEDAYANTLKSRLTFAPQLTEDWGVLVEFDDVRQLGADRSYNDTRNGRTNRPAVFDPEGTDLNQALVRYTGFENTALTLGRQRINRGTQRFIGGVGWRQNEQTYDSFSAGYASEGGFKAFYSYVFQVNRIFGPDSGSPPEDLDSDTHLLDASYKFNDLFNLSGYAYLVDLDTDAFSNWTTGIRADGRTTVGDDVKLSYVAEYAYQEDYENNPVSYDADYYLLQGGVGFSVVDFAVGYEVLGSNNEAGSAFRTPLATLHKFQGWADRFAGVSGSGSYAGLSGSGIEDFYISAAADFLSGRFTLVYHDFEAETGGGSWGEEWDASAAWKFGKHYGLLVKLASYDADDFPANEADVLKFWAQLTANF